LIFIRYKKVFFIRGTFDSVSINHLKDLNLGIFSAIFSDFANQ